MVVSPHPNARSVADLVKHVIEAGLMMAGELTDPDGDFQRELPGGCTAHHAGHLPDDPSTTELQALLRSTLEEGVAKFRAAGEVQMLQTIRRFDGERWTRLAWMYHGIAHEEYHRGQLATYARAQGLIRALTRTIHGASAQ